MTHERNKAEFVLDRYPDLTFAAEFGPIPGMDHDQGDWINIVGREANGFVRWSVGFQVPDDAPPLFTSAANEDPAAPETMEES